MDVYRTEDEQIEAIKSWYQRYGTQVIVGVTLLIVIFFGFKYYQNKQQSELEKASIIYTQLSQLVESDGLSNEKNKVFFDELYGYLTSDHKDTVYASFAALIRASQDVKNNDYEQAEQTLAWILDQNNPIEIEALARLRLARVKSAQGEKDEAIALLQKSAPAFQAEYAEAKGDIYYSQGKLTEALEAYQVAKEKSTNKRPGTLLDMKIDSLNQDPEAIITIKLSE